MGGGFLTTVGGSIVGTMVGSAISRSIFGSGEQAQAAEKQLGPCSQPFQGFLKCLEDNENQIGQCQWAYSYFSQCSKSNQAPPQ
jgi:hypothetical protein